jgi:hypothetical protein
MEELSTTTRGSFHGEDHFAGGQVQLGGHQLRTVLDQRLGLAAGAVPHAHAVAGFEQALDHGFAHASQANPANLVAHAVSLCRIQKGEWCCAHCAGIGYKVCVRPRGDSSRPTGNQFFTACE